MKKSTKIAVSLLLVFSMLLSFGGCGVEKQAETSFNELMQALKSLDFETAQKYMGSGSLLGADNQEAGYERFMMSLFGKLEWEVVSTEKIDGTHVQVTADITAADMTPILSAFFVEALAYAFSGATDSEEEQEAAFMEILEGIAANPDLEMVTNTVTVQMVKGENGWTIETNEAFIDALLGNMKAATEALESTFGAE